MMTFEELCKELFPNGWENFDDNLQLTDLKLAYKAGFRAGQAAPAPVASNVKACKGDLGECEYNEACMYACATAPVINIDNIKPVGPDNW
jgi:hypothetical protein